MSAYFVFEVTITDRSWQEHYLEPTAELIERYGGRYVALGGPEKLEGDRPAPDALVIITFPSMEAARAWHGDPEYRPLMELRQGGSISEALLVDGK